VTFEHADEPLIAPSTVVRITPEDLYEPEPAPVVAQPVQEPAPAIVAKKRRVPLWTLPVAAVIVAAIAAPLLWPKQAPSAEPAPAPAPEPVEIAPKPIKAVEPLAMKLPLHQAEVVASKEKEPAWRLRHSPLRW
jgi:hypothetical protein